ncbi:sigma-70 family RNA polymerase sigma factor [Paenibacillus dokdonensis]|uniref:sigma-70 family RNA polymerase sigma factor n=1 Tax=Paenibacillus dokdonensis TaxID=2567944 RepID=UPI00319DADB1
MAIARRVCLDKLREEPNPVQPLECARGLPSLQSLEEDYQVRSTRTAVREALHELDEKYRIVTVMHHIGGYSAREIAQMLDLKVSAVESRLRRARQKLKEELYDMVHDFLEDNRLEEQKFEKEVTSRLKSLFHMQIPVKDMEESIAWYNQNLGFALRENYGKCAFLELPTGPLLMLWQTADDTSANFTVDGATMPVLLYATDDVHAMHDSLAKSGAVITHYKNEDFGWVLKFVDPNGNMWGVVQEHSGS